MLLFSKPEVLYRICFPYNQSLPLALTNYKLIDDSDDDVEDVNVDTYDNSIFIRSENEITSSVLEMPKNNPSSEEPVQIKDFDDDINSTTSSDH